MRPRKNTNKCNKQRTQMRTLISIKKMSMHIPMTLPTRVGMNVKMMILSQLYRMNPSIPSLQPPFLPSIPTPVDLVVLIDMYSGVATLQTLCIILARPCLLHRGAQVQATGSRIRSPHCMTWSLTLTLARTDIQMKIQQRRISNSNRNSNSSSSGNTHPIQPGRVKTPLLFIRIMLQAQIAKHHHQKRAIMFQSLLPHLLHLSRHLIIHKLIDVVCFAHHHRLFMALATRHLHATPTCVHHPLVRQQQR